jgi:hypothetical protein
MKAKATALCLIALCCVLIGCGSSDGGDSSASSQSTTTAKGAPKAQGGAGDKEGWSGSTSPQHAVHSKNSSQEETDPRVQILRQNFPKPKPAPGAKELSAKAIKAGEEACRSLSPEKVKERFYSQAESNLDPDQVQLVEELPRFEEEAPKDPNFVAGQVAATVYGATLPEAESQYGFQGCVYVLAWGVKGGR